MMNITPEIFNLDLNVQMELEFERIKLTEEILK